MNNNKQEAKKLIEVAMPIKEISAESVRDKSIRHGHISTLHLWWARRPLPVCRAVVFASLVPDPLDPGCPQAFKDAVHRLLGASPGSGDPYKPYDDIPYTAGQDPMEDNLRNRLLMFIGKFSDPYIKNERAGNPTPAKDQLSDDSLIKWDNKNNEAIIKKARQLIWVAHDPRQNTLALYDAYEEAIKKAGTALYETPDRHLDTPAVKAKETALHQAIDAFLDRMPRVFDPFAGGGAIPLEAARLGCRTYANDLNPVAHIIEKASLEFPQEYGKPIIYTKEEFIKLYGQDTFNTLPNDKQIRDESGKIAGVKIHNRLAFDVEFYAKKLLKLTKDEIGHLYPADEEGNKPVAYYWARVGTCSNPGCQAKIPLLRDFYLVKKDNKNVYLNPIIDGTQIDFEIKEGEHRLEGWMYRANLKCPCCGNITDVKTLKQQFLDKKITERMLAVIFETSKGKDYRLPGKIDLNSIENITNPYEKPGESMDNGNYRDLKLPKWGIKLWADMFSSRQLLSMQTMVVKLRIIKKELNFIDTKYKKAILTYLGSFIDRVATRLTSFGLWNTQGEKFEHPFGRQSIPMVFDFPEPFPFSHSSGGAYNQLEWIILYINDESKSEFISNCKNASSGDILQFGEKSLNHVITDPPYYDAIAYADLSDFFYVWLKRTLSDVYPGNFSYIQSPKTEECTALKHHHEDKLEKAKNHFENKLRKIFEAIEKQTNGVVCIMFAHQSTEAWTTLCNSILHSNMNIKSSWAIDTERTSGTKKNKAFLSSSVTVVCNPTEKSIYGDYKEIKEAVEEKVRKEVKFLYNMGFRGADLLTACFGQAVSEFGKYQRVEKADGTRVTVKELLEMARDSAFNAIISDIETDDITRFYIGWLNLFGFTPTLHDDVRSITQIGLNIDVNELLANHILIRDGSKESLADRTQRINANPRLGEPGTGPTIDKVHKAMYLFGHSTHTPLVEYIARTAPNPQHHFWRVLNSLVEILPADSSDHKEAAGLIGSKDSLIREAHATQPPEQKKLLEI